jgi:hypothetical protein
MTGEIMDYYRKIGIIVGILFIVATVASILSSVFLGSALNLPISLNLVSDNANQLIIAAGLQLIAALSAFGTATIIYPVLKKHEAGLAITYVGLRLLENVFYILGVVSLLVLITLSQEYASTINASLIPLSSSIMALQGWCLTLGTMIIFGIGSITLNYILYRSELVPRWLSVWGLIGAVLVIVYGLLVLNGLNPDLVSQSLMVLALPIFAQEMVFAAWLIVKGFNPSAIISPPKRDKN